MRRKTMRTLLATVFLATLAPVASHAQPGSILLQGRLLTSGGPAPDGDYKVTLKFYANKADAKAVFEKAKVPVKVAHSGFSVAVNVDMSAQGPWVSGGVRWLGIGVGTEPELPRLALHSAPFAVRAAVAGDVQCTGCIGAGQLDAKSVQRRVTGGCKANEAIAGIGEDGTVQCTAAHGINSLDTRYQKRVTGTCGAKQAIANISSEGTVTCAEANPIADLDTRYVNHGEAKAVDAKMIDTSSVQARVTGTCKHGEAIAGIDEDGKVKCADLDKQYVRHGEAASVDSAMVKDGSLTAKDIDPTSIQQRVSAFCAVGEAIVAIHDDGKVKCGAAHQFKTLDPRYVNSGEVDSVDSKMLKDGSVTAKDVDSSSVQRRVAGACKSGTAIASIGDDGKVVCVDAGHGQPFTGTVQKGKWYVAAATTKLGGTAILTLTQPFGGPRIRVAVGVVGQASAGATATLIESTYGSSALFDRLRALKTGTGMLVVVRAAASGKARVSVDSDHGANSWTAGPWSVFDPKSLGDGKGEIDLRSTAAWRAQGRGFSLPRHGATAHARAETSTAASDVWLAGDAALEVRSAVAKGKGLDTKTDAMRVFAGNLDGSGTKPLFVVRHDGASAIGALPTDKYALTVGGDVTLKGHDVRDTKAVSWQGGDRIRANPTSGFVSYIGASGGNGGVRFFDNDATAQGGIAYDGQSKNQSFGLVDANNDWAVRIRHKDYISLSVGGQTKVIVRAKGVGILTEPRDDDALTVKGTTTVTGELRLGDAQVPSGYITATGFATKDKVVTVRNVLKARGLAIAWKDTRIYANDKQRLVADDDGVSVDATLRTNSNRVHRDFGHFATSKSADKGINYLHMCTNIPMNGTMFVIEARGFSYEDSEAIHTTWAGYAHAPSKSIKRIHTHSYTKAMGNQVVYKSKDGFVCVVGAARTWYIGVSFSAWTVNPHGVSPYQATGFKVKALKYKLTDTNHQGDRF